MLIKTQILSLYSHREGRFTKYYLKGSIQDIVDLLKSYHPSLWNKLSYRLAELFLDLADKSSPQRNFAESIPITIEMGMRFMKKKEKRIRVRLTTRYGSRGVCGGDKTLIVTMMGAILLVNQLFSVDGFNPLGMQAAHASEAHVGKNHSVNNIDYISDIFVFGSGIFAGILFALSFNAYRNLKTKRLLLVSVAFAIFSVHAIVSKLDLFAVKLESSVLELVLAMLSFVALALFFLAIVRREKIKIKTTTDPPLIAILGNMLF